MYNVTASFPSLQLSDEEEEHFTRDFRESTNQVANLQGLKEEELKGYAPDEIPFLRKVAQRVYQRNNGMIKLSLLFTKSNIIFPFNKTVDLQRTRTELKKLIKKCLKNSRAPWMNSPKTSTSIVLA